MFSLPYLPKMCNYCAAKPQAVMRKINHRFPCREIPRHTVSVKSHRQYQKNNCRRPHLSSLAPQHIAKESRRCCQSQQSIEKRVHLPGRKPMTLQKKDSGAGHAAAWAGQARQQHHRADRNPQQIHRPNIGSRQQNAPIIQLDILSDPAPYHYNAHF